ncbi:Uncharacterised protein [Mycobacteroides abscessus]|nr:Uncharacterised protein [Mycobacteroides abscessus]
MRARSVSSETPASSASYSPWVRSTALPSTTAKLKSLSWYTPADSSQTVSTQRVCRSRAP